MSQNHSLRLQEDNELQKIIEQLIRKKHYFIIGVLSALILAFALNYYSTPKYRISTQISIIESESKQAMGEYINSALFRSGSLQNELLLLKSSPIISKTVTNLDLPVSYYVKKRWKYVDAYKNVPFKVLYMRNHVQPMGVVFEIHFDTNNSFTISAEGKRVGFYNFEKNSYLGEKEKWNFEHKAKVGQLIESSDMSFIIELDSARMGYLLENKTYYFEFADVPTLTQILGAQVQFSQVEMNANVIKISLKSSNIQKGVDILNSITDVYSKQNLEKKNHLAAITIEYIDKQLGEISDSLNQTERILQKFKSTNQLLNVSEQSSSIAGQFRDLQNRKAELVSQLRYYKSIDEYLANNEDYSNMIVPASMGIPDQLLNGLMNELINAYNQKNNLIESKQEKSPAVRRLTIQIDNLKKTIADNISYVVKTTEISLDELNKRLSKVEAEISRMPKTELQLSGIERKYRLNDGIITYLMEKRAEAKITRASNLPDNEIIEPARVEGFGPSFPNVKLNFVIALVLGLVIPFGIIQLQNILNTKIENQEQIEKLTDVPVLGKIMHNNRKSSNVLLEYPNSSIAEGYRALRTNLDYYVRGSHKKVIMVTSSIEGEGKSFNALNIAMSYAQFNRKVILLDFDLRKSNSYFKDNSNLVGLSSYLINKAVLEDIIIKSPHEKLDYIPSGPVPPNPVELIGLEKTEKLIDQLKNTYDYIIIDTPPLAQVTDGYLLIEKADIKIIVTRYNYTIKKVFSFIIKDLSQKNINNLCIVLNDSRFFKSQYGYGYGYTYGKDKRKKANA